MPKKYNQVPRLKVNAISNSKKILGAMAMWNVKKKRPGDVILAKLRMTNGDGDYIDPIHHEVFKEGKDRHPLFYLDQLDIKMVSNNLYERKSHE